MEALTDLEIELDRLTEEDELELMLVDGERLDEILVEIEWLGDKDELIEDEILLLGEIDGLILLDIEFERLELKDLEGELENPYKEFLFLKVQEAEDLLV